MCVSGDSGAFSHSASMRAAVAKDAVARGRCGGFVRITSILRRESRLGLTDEEGGKGYALPRQIARPDGHRVARFAHHLRQHECALLSDARVSEEIDGKQRVDIGERIRLRELDETAVAAGAEADLVRAGRYRGS